MYFQGVTDIIRYVDLWLSMSTYIYLGGNEEGRAALRLLFYETNLIDNFFKIT